MQTFTLQGRSLRATIALVLLSSCLQPAFAATGGSCGAADRLIVALRFAQGLFPELKAREFSVTFSPGNGPLIGGPTDTSDFRIRINDPVWRPTVNGKLQPNPEQSPQRSDDAVQLPFDLHFDFVRPDVAARVLGCQPANFTSTAGYTQMEKVWSAINPHPEWSDAEELVAARKLGLRYGPEDKSAILKKIPLKELAKFYGPLRMKSAEFKMNGGGKCPGCSFADPRWYITASGSGTTHGLLIVVEPFFGKITSISDSE